MSQKKSSGAKKSRYPDAYKGLQVNFCEVGEDKKMPAMRLGLAKAPLEPEDLIYAPL